MTAETQTVALSSQVVTVIVPSCDEAATVGEVVAGLRHALPAARVIVVDDGSTDGTAHVAMAAGAEVLRHNSRRGTGAAIKSGLGCIDDGLVVIIDGDGQHDPARVPSLLAALRDGADLAVAARSDFADSGPARNLGNRLLAALASGMTLSPVPDLTCGMRAFRLARLRPWLHLLPDGFSTPTTTTLSALHGGRALVFVPVPSRPRRGGRTRTRLLRDGAWVFTIALKVTTLFRPWRALLLGVLTLAPVGVIVLSSSPTPAVALLWVLVGLLAAPLPALVVGALILAVSRFGRRGSDAPSTGSASPLSDSTPVPASVPSAQSASTSARAD